MKKNLPIATKAALAVLLALLALPAVAAVETNEDVAFEGRCASFGMKPGGGSGLVGLPVRNDGDAALDLAFKIVWLSDPANDATMGADAPAYILAEVQPGALRLEPGAKVDLRISLAVLEGAPETFEAAFRLVATSGERVWTGPLVVVRDAGFRGPDPHCNGPMDPSARVTRTRVDEHAVAVTETFAIPEAGSAAVQAASPDVEPEAEPAEPAIASGGILLATLGGAAVLLGWRLRA